MRLIDLDALLEKTVSGTVTTEDILSLSVVETDIATWVPIKFRDADEDEKECGYTWMFDCRIPDDGEDTLVTDGRNVWIDTWYEDDGWCLDSDYDIGKLTAWMPLPKPYLQDGK